MFCVSLVFESGDGDSAYLAQTTVNKEVGAIDEAALVAGKEDNGVGLLDGLTEATGGEVNFTTEPLGLVLTEPVLEERCAKGNVNTSSKSPLRQGTGPIQKQRKGETYLRGPGQRELNRNPSRA